MSNITEELKTIKSSTSIVRVSFIVEKLYKKIADDLKRNIPKSSIVEIDLLKSQCKTENCQLNLLSCSAFVKLVDESNLDAKYVMTMFLTMLPNSSSGQNSAITEGIISLMLLNLKRDVAALKSNEKYECPYGFKISQHPLIAILQRDGVNMMDLSNKISGIFNHYDQQIQTYSLEYLRPVFLYVFCNPQIHPESKTIWTGLLELTRKNSDVKLLLNEIISWSKINSSSTCIFTTIILIEAIYHFEANSDYVQANDMIIYLAHIINEQLKYGLDPRPSLQCILQCSHSAKDSAIRNHYNILLIILSDILQHILPIYLPELLRIISFIVVTENYGNQFILNMILDGIMHWMAYTLFIPPEGVAIAIQITTKITLSLNNGNNSKNTKDNWDIPSTIDYKNSNVRYLDSNIAVAFDIAKLAESFDQSEYKNIFTFVDNINAKLSTSSSSSSPSSTKLNNFYQNRIQFFLRGLFLSREPSIDCWFKIYQSILTIMKNDENIAYDFLMTYIYKLGNEINPEVQLELLRGLPLFAVSKSNVPMILNTIKSLSNGINATLCMDLYFRLWKQEIRTYKFLIKFLSQPNKNKDQMWEWQYNVAKANTIHDICLERPSQSGADLISHLSDILNTCVDESGDLATSIALDGIVALCENTTVSITSTWRILSNQFRHEKRPKTLKSLYNFFGQVPILKSQTIEYDRLVDEALKHLWDVIAYSNSPELIREALKNLIHFQETNLMTLEHIPDKFKYSIKNIDDHIPGEIWVELIQKINSDCKCDAADLISKFIHEEIKSYRSGIYYLPDGRLEPVKLQGLYSKSPLRAVVSFLVSQSRFVDHVIDAATIISCLRMISKKFTKPIPPVDWSFLLSFLNLNFQARKYSLLIVKNQCHSSGTARRLLENFLNDFEPNCFEEDLLLLFKILPEFVTGVSLNVLKVFCDKTALYCFKESQLNGFPEGCIFEKFLCSIRSVLTSKCESIEIVDMFTKIVERYMDSMDLDSKLFERYTEVVATLSTSSIEDLTSPANWWEKPIGKLKKATIIRCYLVLYNKELENPLMWLNPIIDAYSDKLDEQIFLFRHLTATFYAFSDEKSSYNWLMDKMLRQIQTIISEIPTDEKLQKLYLLLDIFVLAIDVFSNVAVLAGNLDLLATSRDLRIEIFPESVQVLCDELVWKDNDFKVYEFLFLLYKNNYVPEYYSEMFKNSIICSRNRPYFDSKGTWMKYVGMRK